MINKTAVTTNPVLEVIKQRWSPRSFKKQAISQTDLNTILEAASWAFSANNMQPWNYIYAHNNDASFENLVKCLMPGNLLWAKNASVLMAAIINKNSPTGNLNKAATHDMGAANATLALQAQSMGISAHVMGGFDATITNEILKINTNEQEVLVFVALGYADSADKLDEPFKTRELTPRTRKFPEEFSKKF